MYFFTSQAECCNCTLDIHIWLLFVSNTNVSRIFAFRTKFLFNLTVNQDNYHNVSRNIRRRLPNGSEFPLHRRGMLTRCREIISLLSITMRQYNIVCRRYNLQIEYIYLYSEYNGQSFKGLENRESSYKKPYCYLFHCLFQRSDNIDVFLSASLLV